MNWFNSSEMKVGGTFAQAQIRSSGLTALATLLRHTFGAEQVIQQAVDTPVVARELRIRAHVPSFDAAYRMVQAGTAQTILPREAVSRYAELFGLRIIPLTDPWARGEFVICVRDQDALSPSARRLLNHLLAEIPPQD